MDAGSNIDQWLADGKGSSLYMPDVFIVGNAPDWQLVTAVYKAPPTLTAAAFVPVAKASSKTSADAAVEYDNLRVTLYEGTAFAAEAVRVAKPPVIDGKLDDWDFSSSKSCPIPLLGPGQTTVRDPQWKAAPGNLSGVVHLAWDDANLYLAAEVCDDVVVTQTGEQAIQGDSLVLALHPANRAPGTDDKAFAYYLSAASPGGGSGRVTLFRPAAHAGGLSSGQLAKDSSVHEIAITRSGDRTIYEARFPWSELGVVGRFGTKLGCTLQLNDNDGAGRAASITWGAGLEPTWSPDRFGVVTLVEP